MNATCNVCGRIIAPSTPIIGERRNEFMRLAEAMTIHFERKHPKESAESLMAAMNCQAVFLLRHFVCADPEYIGIVRTSISKLTDILAPYASQLDHLHRHRTEQTPTSTTDEKIQIP